MSKIIYVCSRNHNFDSNTENKLSDICNALVPDNITRCADYKIYVEGRLAYAVTMKNSALLESDMSVLLGFRYSKQETNWTTQQHNYPDGNYVLFRNGDDNLEVLCDGVGSRTIWYYHDDEIFIASTSQRGAIMFLGSFVFDERVIPWVLSTGTLGPQFSWDIRLHRLQADSSVLLNKKTWVLSLNKNPITFTEVKNQRKKHKEILTDAIRQTINTLGSIDYNQWILPLSGGYDSRAILCFIKEQIGLHKDLRTVTWGLETSVHEDGNDAKIAKELAHSIGVHHDYFNTDMSSEPIETIIDRFIHCSEGRIDHLSGYMDGMEIWKRFHDENITGLIRGDEGFGWSQVSSELTVRLAVGCALCSDYVNLKNIIADFNLHSQQLPKELTKNDTETLSEWRDRLYHTFRIPTILAALSDIKLTYIEQINPLLSKTILTAVRSMPDNLRTNKTLFKEITNTIGPNIPIANKSAIANLEDILKKKQLINLFKREINSSYANNLLGDKFVQFICDQIKDDKSTLKTRNQQLKQSLKRHLPRFIKNLIRDKAIHPKVDGNVLAFRVFIILRMHKILTSDVAKFNHSSNP